MNNAPIMLSLLYPSFGLFFFTASADANGIDIFLYVGQIVELYEQSAFCAAFSAAVLTDNTAAEYCHYQVTGSHQPIIAAPGDDVILLCHVEPPLDVVDLTVEWSKPDSDLKRYVHLYRDNRDIPDMKMSTYDGRTALSADGLRRGNISLMITNVTAADGGQYKCFIPKFKGSPKWSLVQLIIDKNSSKAVTTETPLSVELTRQNDLNGGASCCSRLTLFTVVCVSLIFSA